MADFNSEIHWISNNAINFEDKIEKLNNSVIDLNAQMNLIKMVL